MLGNQDGSIGLNNKEENKLILENHEFNFIKKELFKLESAYKQSSDIKVKISVKDQVFFKIQNSIYGFGERYEELFKKCSMDSLQEIDELTNIIFNNIVIKKCKSLEISDLKKNVKLKDRQLKSLINDYNEVIETENISYFSKQIDDKFIIILPVNNEFMVLETRIFKNTKKTKNLCCFCNMFREADELISIVNTKKGKLDNYSSLANVCCKDFKTCNSDIIDIFKIKEFIEFNKK